MSKHSNFESPDYSRAFQLVAMEGRTPAQAIKVLRKEGHSEKSAQELIAQVKAEIGPTNGRGGGRDIVIGALWCIGGTIATIYSDYFIFWGAIVFGAFQLIRGAVVRYAPKD